ncbi:winged helix-turn-helix domain-containing protein [uncultured Pontibacter sp.]|uniref:winged helix-turn-helix domain-containing protein n=1 Tax=uncultured Pontibacter sp. TaxID=453356 RepID=UPI0026098302|nr:winged helix-turn-helix domain-containing protein [uncultured Pontibacter sp.]
MKSTKNSLQKFTDTQAKIDKLLALDSITYDDLEILTKDERSAFEERVTEEFNSLTDRNRDKFFKKIEPIMSKDSKSHNWESNHNQITYAISTLMQDYGRMPSKTEIATKTGLSRQTVHKHLKEYATHPIYLEQLEQFRFMTDKVLARVFKYAVNGDVSAAKLFLTMMTPATPKQNGNTLIQTQNNYIQINGTVLSQEALQQLSPEQLNDLEEILKTALPQAAHKLT